MTTVCCLVYSTVGPKHPSKANGVLNFARMLRSKTHMRNVLGRSSPAPLSHTKRPLSRNWARLAAERAKAQPALIPTPVDVSAQGAVFKRQIGNTLRVSKGKASLRLPSLP